MQLLFEKQCVRLDLSGGAFWDGEMVGFILNAQACYNGELSAFDVGTGVVPEHRGNGVFHHLLQFVECELERQQIRKYYLEVMRENESAISLYQNCGFSIVREVSVLVGDALPRREKIRNACESGYLEFDFQLAGECHLVQPSFENATGILQRNPDLYKVIYVMHEKQISGFCVVSRENGSIHQIGYCSVMIVPPYSGKNVRGLGNRHPVCNG